MISLIPIDVCAAHRATYTTQSNPKKSKIQLKSEKKAQSLNMHYINEGNFCQDYRP